METVSSDNPFSAAALAAVDDQYIARGGRTVTLNVLQNDGEDSALLAIITQPRRGTAEISGNAILYTPDEGAAGVDTFVYSALQNGETDTAAVTVNIVPQEAGEQESNEGEGGLAVSDSSVNVNEDTTVRISAPEGITFTDITVQPQHGTVAIENNVLVYTPDADYNGADMFGYAAENDAGDSGSAQVTLNIAPVNDAPVTENEAVTINAGDTQTVDVLANDSDKEGSALTLVRVAEGSAPVVTATIENNQLVLTPDAGFTGSADVGYIVADEQGAESVAKVTVTVPQPEQEFTVGDSQFAIAEDNVLRVSPAETLTFTAVTEGPQHGVAAVVEGRLVYTPAENYNGADSFSYSVRNEDGEIAEASIAVTVTPVNDAPVAGDDEVTINAGESLTVDVLANDIDPEGDTPLTITGILEESAEQIGVEIVGNQLQLTPQEGFAGSFDVGYEVTDANGATGVGIVTVTVPVTEQEPVLDLQDITSTIAEDTTVTFNAPEGVTFTDITENPQHGTARIEGNQIIYTPEKDYNGADSFGISGRNAEGATDTASVSFTITPVNDAPVTGEDSYVINADSEDNVFDVLANDSDPDGDALSISEISVEPNFGTATIVDGTIVYTPDEGFSGADQLYYRAADADGAFRPAKVTITVNAADTPAPEARDDVFTLQEDAAQALYDVLANDTAGGTITDIQGNGIFADVRIIDNNIAYTPAPDVNGQEVINYTVTYENGAAAQASATFNTVPVNDAPIAQDDSASLQAGDTLAVDVLANDNDIDGDDLIVSAVNSGNAAVGASIDGDNKIVVSPDAGFSGTAQISYTVSDGNGGTDEAVLTVTVSPNEVPLIANDDEAVSAEDSVTDIDVLANDTGGTGAKTLDEVISAENVTANIVNNRLSIKPDLNFNGVAAIVYAVIDANGNRDTATLTLNVTPVNDAPVANDDSAATDAGAPVTVDVSANDNDVDGDDLTLSLTEDAPAGGKIRIEDGKIVYTPDEGYSGEDSFGYEVSDGQGGTDSATVTVNVAPGEDNGENPGNTGGEVEAPDNTSGAKTVTGTDGADVIVEQGAAANINAGDGFDRVLASDENDVINGEGGDDSVWGFGGDDMINGGDGNDYLEGGDGNDNINGGAGNDIVQGNAGDDNLSGGDGDDMLRGGDGDNTLYGGLGEDLIIAGSGKDRIVFTSYEDSVTGARDYVIGFEQGQDVFDVSAIPGASYEDLTFFEGVAGTRIDGPDGFSVHVAGDITLTPDDFDFI